MVFRWSLSDSKSVPVSRTLFSILAYVNNAWVNMAHFLHHLDSDIRKETRKLERLHTEIMKKKIFCSLHESLFEQ